VEQIKEKSFERKNELIEAALDEFTTKSYENASLNKIIKNAGISKGTFYYHFQDKQGLYAFLLETAYKTALEFSDKRMEELAQDFEGKDIFEKLKLQIQIGAEFAITFPKYLRLTLMSMKEEENKEMFENVNSSRVKTIETEVEQMVTKAIKRGDFNERFSKNFIIKIMTHLSIHYSEIFDVEAYYEMPRYLKDVNNFVDFLKYGFGK